MHSPTYIACYAFFACPFFNGTGKTFLNALSKLCMGVIKNIPHKVDTPGCNRKYLVVSFYPQAKLFMQIPAYAVKNTVQHPRTTHNLNM